MSRHLLVFSIMALLACTDNGDDDSVPVDDTHRPVGSALQLDLVAQGLSSPTNMAALPDGSLLVTDQPGLIWRIEDETTMGEKPWADLRHEVIELMEGFDERGLLGIAVDPDYDDNNRIYLFMSTPFEEGDNPPKDYDHMNRVVMYETDGADDPTLDLDSKMVVWDIAHPYFNHNGGEIAFGPDGMLYITLGDGGNKNDIGLGHPPLGNGQDRTTQHGSILRIDVSELDEPYGYAIPEDNPFAGGAKGADEVYAYGLRNPTRLSWSEAGELYVPDVGQSLMEEVNLIETAGANYGWNIKEGTMCFNPDDELDPLEDCANQGPFGQDLLPPIMTFSNSADPGARQTDFYGTAVVGGALLEEGQRDELDGAYLFGTWSLSQEQAMGALFLGEERNGAWEMDHVDYVDRDELGYHLLGIDKAPSGTIYLLVSDDAGPLGTGGRIYQVGFES